MEDDALEYERILQNGVLPTTEKLSKEERSDVIVQYENAPVYTAKTTISGLRSPSGSCFGFVGIQI